MHRYNFQRGGGNCSLCGSPNTNKSTCPLNTEAVYPNPEKHPFAMKKSIKTTSVSEPPIVKIKTIKKQSVVPPVPSVQLNSDKSEQAIDLPNDIIIEIMLNMEPSELIKACQLNKFSRDVCKEHKLFWKRYAQRYSDRIIVDKNRKNNIPVYFQGELKKTDPNLSWRDLFTNAYQLGQLRHAFNRLYQPNAYNPDTAEPYDNYVAVVKKIGNKGWIDVLRPFIGGAGDGWILMAPIYQTGLENNLTEILDYMLAHKRELANQWKYVIRDASPESAKYLESKGVVFTADIFNSASASGNLPLIKYMVLKGHRPDDINLEWAVTNRHTDVIEYFWSLGMNKRVGVNHLFEGLKSNYTSVELEKNFKRTLKLFIDNDIYGTNNETIFWAIRNDRPDVLEYIYNVNQLSNSEGQYNIFRKMAQEYPEVRAWFDTKTPVFKW